MFSMSHTDFRFRYLVTNHVLHSDAIYLIYLKTFYQSNTVHKCIIIGSSGFLIIFHKHFINLLKDLNNTCVFKNTYQSHTRTSRINI